MLLFWTVWQSFELNMLHKVIPLLMPRFGTFLLIP